MVGITRGNLARWFSATSFNPNPINGGIPLIEIRVVASKTAPDAVTLDLVAIFCQVESRRNIGQASLGNTWGTQKCRGNAPNFK